MDSTYKFARRPAETDAEYEARCAQWREHFSGSGHALDMEAVPTVVAAEMRIANGERLAISTADLTDAEMQALAAARTPPEHDYDYDED